MVNRELYLPAKTQDDRQVEILLNAGLSADTNITESTRKGWMA